VNDVGGTGEAVAEQAFPPELATIAVARRWVESTLDAWGCDDLSWTAMLVVTELSTNAVLHAATSYRVTLGRRNDGSVRIGVTDGSTRKPREREYGVDATTGRGLGLVGSISSAWGTSSLPDGKTVWADVHPESPSSMSIEPDLDAFLLDDDLDIGTPSPLPSPVRDEGPQAKWAIAA